MNRLTKSQQASTGARRRGFSILELVVAMALIGLLVLAVYGAITSGMGTIRMARENLRAPQILLEKMEAIRLYNWAQMNPSFIPPQFIANYELNSGSTNSRILYYGTVELAKANTGLTYENDLKQVTVRLRWKTGAIARTRAMTTYVCSTGIQNYIY